MWSWCYLAISAITLLLVVYRGGSVLGMCSQCIISLGFLALLTLDQYLLMVSPFSAHCTRAFVCALVHCFLSRCSSSLCIRASLRWVSRFVLMSVWFTNCAMSFFRLRILLLSCIVAVLVCFLVRWVISVLNSCHSFCGL